jgi:hypothetical protein
MSSRKNMAKHFRVPGLVDKYVDMRTETAIGKTTSPMLATIPFDAPSIFDPAQGRHAIPLCFVLRIRKIVKFFTMFSDQRERVKNNRAVARIG